MNESEFLDLEPTDFFRTSDEKSPVSIGIVTEEGIVWLEEKSKGREVEDG